MRTVCFELGEVKHKAHEIGIQLGIPYCKMMEFKRDGDILSAAVNYWLSGNLPDVPITWESLVTALESDYVGESGCAKKIKDKGIAVTHFLPQLDSLGALSVIYDSFPSSPFLPTLPLPSLPLFTLLLPFIKVPPTVLVPTNLECIPPAVSPDLTEELSPINVVLPPEDPLPLIPDGEHHYNIMLAYFV